MPSLIKLYTDAHKRFISQINNNRGINWEKNFNSMRVALHQCLKELSLESAVQQYQKLYNVMQEYPPENDFSVAGAVTELVVESGWLLFNRNIDENNNPLLQSVLFYISTAVMHYSCINLICADHFLDEKLLSESQAYYQATCEMLIDFLEKLHLLKVEHTIDTFPLGNEVRRLILKRAFLSMEQKKCDEVTELLSQYEEVSSRHLFNESEQVKLERLRECGDLHEWLKKQSEIKAIETEVKRRNKKIKGLPSVDSVDQIFDINILTRLKITLELQKEHEASQKILDEINLRQNRIFKQISLINEMENLILESVFHEIIAQEMFDIVSLEKETHHKLLINEISMELLESVVSEILRQDLFYVSNNTTQSLELQHSISKTSAINTSTENISEISISFIDDFPSCLANIPHFIDRKPSCAQDKYSEFINYFSIILERNNCDAFLFGSANYKRTPNDLDILLNSNDMKTINALMGEIILNHGGAVVANYEKINRRIVKMYFHGMLIDFIFSSETILEHSKRLDFTIGALYFDLRRKVMFCPNYNAFRHIQVKQLHTISEARQMFENDPSVIFRAVRIMASEKFSLSESSYIAIKEAFIVKNLFIRLNPDKLYYEIVQLFFSGHAVRTLEILVKELEIFQYIFSRLNELNQPMYALTLSMVECVADMSDDYVWNSSQYLYPPSPSLFYYAVHWFIFIKDNVAQSAYPNINLAQGLTPNLNYEVDYNNKKDLHALEYYHLLLPGQLSFKEYYLQSRNSFWSNKKPIEQSCHLDFNSDLAPKKRTLH